MGESYVLNIRTRKWTLVPYLLLTRLQTFFRSPFYFQIKIRLAYFWEFFPSLNAIHIALDFSVASDCPDIFFFICFCNTEYFSLSPHIFSVPLHCLIFLSSIVYFSQILAPALPHVFISLRWNLLFKKYLSDDSEVSILTSICQAPLWFPVSDYLLNIRSNVLYPKLNLSFFKPKTNALLSLCLVYDL